MIYSFKAPSSQPQGKATVQKERALVFIDAAVPDYLELAQGVIAAAEVIILRPDQNGIEALTKQLQHRTDIASIHLVAHGAPGCFYLGTTELSLDTLTRYAPLLQTWKADALFLHSCHVAAGDAGEEFIAKLYEITGSAIAASTTPIGNAALGGNWELDTTTGSMAVPQIFSAAVREQYASVLATYIVDTAVDEDNGLNSGRGTSLREAIAAANASSGSDTITFSNSLSGSKILLERGELEITDALSINGLGSNKLTIDAQGNSRIFNIDDGSFTGIEVAIADLKLRGGSSDKGGAIFNHEELTLVDSIVTGNTASGRGGAIHSGNYSQLTVRNSTIKNNVAGGGGGLYVGYYAYADVFNSLITGNTAAKGGGGVLTFDGTTTLIESTVSGNTATDGGGVSGYGGTPRYAAVTRVIKSTISNNSAVRGGGSFTGPSIAVLELIDSTVSGNAATTDGGGVYHYASDGLTITNSTLSGNSAGRNGGGVFIENYLDEDFEISNSTITKNIAVGSGSGIYSLVDGSDPFDSVVLVSTIVADNQGDKDIVGVFESLGGNVIGNGSNASGFTADDLVGTAANPIDPKLNLLGDYGGPTQTHSLQSDSPAIDAGRNPQGLITDQRGLPRTEGTATDSGSVESDAVMGNVINGTNQKDNLVGTEGDDIINGLGKADTLSGEAGDDVLDGGFGRDRLNGGLGNDTLLGGGGADTLVGGENDDSLTGGGGADTFYVEGFDFGADTITDFQVGTDTIRININRLNDNFGELTLTQVGSDTKITFSGSGVTFESVTLQDVNASALSRGDFAFGALA